MLVIKGLQKTSLVDYPGKVAATIFFAGCNFRCPFCHNKDLVLDYNKLKTIKEEEILKFLEKRKKWLDGVCLTGGEPTLYEKLPDFIIKIKKIGLLVKLDTNGADPEMIECLVKKRLIDSIAMDIKGSLAKYDKPAGVEVDIKKIKKSIDIIKKSDVDYEFRMTVVPGLHEERDFEEIGKLLENVKRFAIQQFQAKNCIDSSFNNIKPFDNEKLKKFKKILEKYIEKVEIKNI